uniref:Uncharacterized protein n=1 Tax=Rhizophora mucronata TaxID=61149 RepID=A0A2P2IU98_RHIMU
MCLIEVPAIQSRFSNLVIASVESNRASMHEKYLHKHCPP